MQPRHLMPLAAILIAVFVATLLATPFALAHSDDPRTIVVVSEILRAGRLIFLVILAHALLLGLPLFLFLRSRIRVGLIVCLVAGFLVGAVPLPLLGLLATSGGNYSAWTGGTPIVVNGIPTLVGLLQYAQIAGLFGAFGLAAAFTFWAILRWSGGSALEPFANEASLEIPRPRQWPVASAAILLTCGVVVLPSVVIDRSCHNLFLDGRSSVSPQIFAYIELNAEDWPKLTQIFDDFGSAHSLELRTDQNVRNEELFWRDLNLCNETGVNIDAVDEPWLIEVNSPIPRGVKFAVYEMKPYSGWGPLARDLVGKIAASWPEKMKFHGPDGRVISEAEALKGRSQ